MSYLSLAPEGVHTALVTGGLPSLHAHADDVYRPPTRASSARSPRTTPVTRRTSSGPAGSPTTSSPTTSSSRNGYRFTVEAFQSLGLMLGASDGSHRLPPPAGGRLRPHAGGLELADAFQEQVQALPVVRRPPPLRPRPRDDLRQDARPTAWAAERVRAEFPQFDAAKALAGDGPVLFTGETVHPWMFDADPALRPLRETAELLAARTDWGPLYDPARLAANEVPAAAAVYHDDMYVDTAHSLETAAAIRGLRPWVTNEYEHDGLRAGAPRVLDRLLALVRDEV